MQNQNRVFWIGLVIAIAFALWLESIKSDSTSVWRPRMASFGFQAGDDDESGAISAQTAAGRARARLRARIGGLATSAQIEQSTNQSADQTLGATTKPDEAKSNLGAPLKVDADAAKKKAAEDKKKKKKKKKKTEAEAQKKESEAQTASEDKTKKTDEDVSGSSNVTAQGANDTSFVGGSNNENNDTESPQTLEQWLTFILREPDYERTMKLIEKQQTGAIDGKIFHEVVSEMLLDSRPKMQELAILALGSTPSLKSFLMLESISSTGQMSSANRVQSRTYLKSYARAEKLRYLVAAMGAPDANPEIARDAMLLIQLSVRFYTQPTQPTASGSQPVKAPAAVALQFNPLVPVLKRIAQTSPNASLRNEAAKTLQQVQTIVGSAPSHP